MVLNLDCTPNEVWSEYDAVLVVRGSYWDTTLGPPHPPRVHFGDKLGPTEFFFETQSSPYLVST